MDDLYSENFVAPEAVGNAEIFAKMKKLDKKVRRLEKKKRKGGKKGRKKELKKQLQRSEMQQKSTWSWDSVLTYATPKFVDLFFEKMAEPQIRIIPVESNTKLALPDVIGRD
jgi:hypothetical protein